MLFAVWMAEREHCLVTKSIAYGNTSFWLGPQKARKGVKTHRWCVYLRSTDGYDLSTFIARVTFELHESFANHLRSFIEPPFELTELGWGEFEIKIHIEFRDETTQPVVLSHYLQLFPLGDAPESSTVPIIKEAFDELIFVNPTKSLYELLMIRRPQRPLSVQSFMRPWYVEAAVSRLSAALARATQEQERLCAHIARLTEAQRAARADAVALERRLRDAGLPVGAAPSSAASSTE